MPAEVFFLWLLWHQLIIFLIQVVIFLVLVMTSDVHCFEQLFYNTGKIWVLFKSAVESPCLGLAVPVDC